VVDEVERGDDVGGFAEADLEDVGLAEAHAVGVALLLALASCLGREISYRPRM
jgi:hypothetical protein